MGHKHTNETDQVYKGLINGSAGIICVSQLHQPLSQWIFSKNILCATHKLDVFYLIVLIYIIKYKFTF